MNDHEQKPSSHAQASHATTISVETTAELERLRTRLSDVIFEIDDIELQVNPAIKRDYAVKIAYFENDLLEADIEARRAKRKLAMARAQANMGEPIAEDLIESMLQDEFASWKVSLKEHLDDYLKRLEERASTRAMSAHDTRELKRLHRLLIKRLHPDTNIGHEEECERFFLLAQAAYENGDLDLMRSVEAATTHLGPGGRAPESEDEAQAEIAIVQARVDIAQGKLNVLKTSNPYALKEKLDDAQWVAETVMDLKERTAQHRRARDYYLDEYRSLKEGGCRE